MIEGNPIRFSDVLGDTIAPPTSNIEDWKPIYDKNGDDLYSYGTMYKTPEDILAFTYSSPSSQGRSLTAYYDPTIGKTGAWVGINPNSSRTDGLYAERLGRTIFIGGVTFGVTYAKAYFTALSIVAIGGFSLTQGTTYVGTGSLLARFGIASSKGFLKYSLTSTSIDLMYQGLVHGKVNVTQSGAMGIFHSPSTAVAVGQALPLTIGYGWYSDLSNSSFVSFQYGDLNTAASNIISGGMFGSASSALSPVIAKHTSDRVSRNMFNVLNPALTNASADGFATGISNLPDKSFRAEYGFKTYDFPKSFTSGNGYKGW